MDELSTYFHCSDKTFIEFIDTNKSGAKHICRHFTFNQLVDKLIF